MIRLFRESMFRKDRKPDIISYATLTVPGSLLRKAKGTEDMLYPESVQWTWRKVFQHSD